jgi:ATP-dependent DNA helicase RecG
MTTHAESSTGARPRTRPPELEPVFRPVAELGGVGTHLSKMLVKVAGPEIVDMLWHLPVALLDRRYTPKVAELKQACVATLELTVDRHERGHGRSPYRVRCRDETGFIELVFFNVRGPYLLKQLPVGEKRLVSGKVEFYNGLPQMAHPDAILPVTARDRIAVVQAIYRLTGGLTAPMLDRMMRAALVRTPELPEWLDTGLQRQRNWPDWRAAMLAVHNPETEADLLPAAPARQRLAYDELLAHQLALALVREQNRRSGGRSNVDDGRLREAAVSALPYRLTGAQERSLSEILHDMGDHHRMLRLLQCREHG